MCVSCHGVYVKDVKLKHKTFKLEEGVSCVVCHGAYANWVDQHGSVLRREEWRTLSRSTKEQSYGMTDLWDPAKRARLCLSCHVGSVEEGKVITHAMYAAGHPPLPAVEIATFSNAMRHWEYLKEKNARARKLLRFDPDDAAVEQTKLVMVSGIVSLRETMSLLAGQAGAATSGTWPEFAQFDCYACHHELKTPSWRQQRGYPGKPGRPQMRSWPLTLAKLALNYLGEDEKTLQRSLATIHAAFDSQPFGNPQEIASSARQVVQWSDQLLRKLEQKKISKTDCLKLLRLLCSEGADGILDYDSARQIIWAFRIIYGECFPDSAVKPAHDAKIKELLEALDRELKLQLPSGRDQSIVDQLGESLRKINTYDPVRFKDEMTRLGKLLPKK
jgi:hypothetical protein